MTTVADLMSANVAQVALTATLADAALRMVEGRISSVVVVDHDTVIGIITERDVLHAMRLHQDHARPVSELMAAPVHTVSADLDFREAFRTAAKLGIRHLVVCDAAGHPQGVVTETDFRRHLGLDFFRQLHTVDALMERTFPRLPATASLSEALLAMEAVHASCVVVVDGALPLGIVTERDVVRLYLQEEGDPPLAEVMTAPLAEVRFDTSVAEAAERMLVSRIRHLVVVDADRHLVGMLSEHSLMRPLELDMIDDALAERLQLVAAHDIDVHQLARNERYQRALLDNFPFLVWLKDTESRFLAVNKPFAEAAGQASVDVFPGKSDLDVWPLDLATAYRADDSAVMAAGVAKNVIEPVLDHGIRRWFETYKAPVVGADGCLLGTVGFARDISERKREEEAILIRNAALAGVLRGDPLNTVFELVALSLEKEIPDSFCAIFVCDAQDNALHLAAAPTADPAWQAEIRAIEVGEGCGCSGTAAFRRETVFIENFATDALGARYREWARQAGLAAACALPLTTPAGDLLGVLTLYQKVPGRTDSRQDALLIQCAQLAALILAQQNHRQHADDALQSFRGIFNSVSEALFVQDAAGTFLDVNTAALDFAGIPARDLLGKTQVCLAAEGLNDLPAVAECIQRAVAGQSQKFDFWARNAAGRVFPCQVSLQPCVYFGQSALIASVQDISERRAAELRMRIEFELAAALVSGQSRQAMLANFLEIALCIPEFDAGGLSVRQADGTQQFVASIGVTPSVLERLGTQAAARRQAKRLAAGELQCSCSRASVDCGDSHLHATGELLQEGVLCAVVMPLLVEAEVVATLYLVGRATSQVSRTTCDSLPLLHPLFAKAMSQLEAQEAAKVLQRNLSGLFDSLHDLLFILDAAGCIQHYNKAVSEQLDYGPDELLGQSMACVHPADYQKEAAEKLAAILAGQCQACALPMLRKNGGQVMVEMRVVSGFWNGEPALFGLAQDISERLLAEEHQRLAASVFENAHEGIMITDPQGRIVEVNPTFTELTGYTRDEALGQTTDLLRSGHHEPAFYAEMWRSIQERGYWRGEVWNRKKTGEIFAELLNISTVRNRTGEISHFVGIFSDITVLKAHQQRLEHLAHFDALTQLPNRMLLSDRLQLAMAQTDRQKNILAVAYLDLDDFKPVNDQFGHAAGDRLLVEVAQRLRQCVRGGDTVARLGGDEFVLLFAELDDEVECDRAVGRVLSALVSPFHIAGHEVHISASIGVTLYPFDGVDADALLRHADQAMYAAKQAGRNCYHLFDAESDRRAKTWREEQEHVRQALAAREFVLYYQPKVHMREGRVCGAEALVRWQHPERGLLLPDDFLPSIENADLDVELGEWVIRSALQQMANWQQAGLQMPVSVNISGGHLLTEGFVERLVLMLAEFPEVSPTQLELEVLETAALEDMARAAEVFTACGKLGVGLALDDFGTGYSSLTYFRRLPVDVLKIDQSFVCDMLDNVDDLAIVEGIIGLTKAFRRKVIAEGVETPEHGMLLLQLGCDLAQGFGIAHPMPAAEVAGWVASFVPDEMWSSVAAFPWSREDLPLLLAEGDHLRWVRSVLDYAQASPVAQSNLALAHTDCRFGQWYYGDGGQRYAQCEGYCELEKMHVELHVQAQQLITLCQSGADAASLARAQAELQTMSTALSEGIRGLQAEVLLATVRQGQ